MAIDVVYSPDDGGWYAERFGAGPERVTAVYATRFAALAAARREAWDDDDDLRRQA
jgi:hypothetical protein